MYLALRNRNRIKITQEQADKLAQVLMGSDLKYFMLEGCLFPVSEFGGIETDIVGDTAMMIQQGKWQCWKSNWHGKNDFCKCERDVNYGEQLNYRSEGRLTLGDGVKTQQAIEYGNSIAKLAASKRM